MVPAFKSAAEELLNSSGLPVIELLAKALAKAVVYMFFVVNFSFLFFVNWFRKFSTPSTLITN